MNTPNPTRLTESFFHRDVLKVAPELCGKWLCRRLPTGEILRLQISETEAYRGEEDSACHAHRGRTPRTEVLYARAGTMYVYLCYGMHWLLNAVTGEEGEAQAVLIRACKNAEGPGKLTRALGITGEFHRDSFLSSDALWIEDDHRRCRTRRERRVGIGYAKARDQARKWRWILTDETKGGSHGKQKTL